MKYHFDTFNRLFVNKDPKKSNDVIVGSIFDTQGKEYCPTVFSSIIKSGNPGYAMYGEPIVEGDSFIGIRAAHSKPFHMSFSKEVIENYNEVSELYCEVDNVHIRLIKKDDRFISEMWIKPYNGEPHWSETYIPIHNFLRRCGTIVVTSHSEISV